MSIISAGAVKTLRDRTNLPMMECKSALTEASGDMEKAVEILRKKFKDAQDKRAGREAAEGRVAVYIDDVKKVASIVEMRCESAPTAKNEMFVDMANDIARHVALHPAASVEDLLAQPLAGGKTVNDRIGEVVGVIREHMKPARFQRVEGLAGGYVHHDGSVGVLIHVQGEKADPQLLRDVCMHITARNPMCGLRSEIPEATLTKEKEIAQAQIAADPKNANKPPQILERIIEGKLKTYFAENVLVEQPFVKDDTKTVGQLLQSAGLTLIKFYRYKVGELS